MALAKFKAKEGKYSGNNVNNVRYFEILFIIIRIISINFERKQSENNMAGGLLSFRMISGMTRMIVP